MSDKGFIKTFDCETASKLRHLGFQEVISDGNSFVFLNCNKINFEKDIDVNKISYTDMLFI